MIRAGLILITSVLASCSSADVGGPTRETHLVATGHIPAGRVDAGEEVRVIAYLLMDQRPQAGLSQCTGSIFSQSGPLIVDNANRYSVTLNAGPPEVFVCVELWLGGGARTRSYVHPDALMFHSVGAPPDTASIDVP